MERGWQMSITSEYRDHKRLELLANFPTDVEIDGEVGPLLCARLFEEKAFQNAHGKKDYEQRISQCVELSQKTQVEYERLLAQWKQLGIGGGNSRPRAGEHGSSSSSTMSQAGAQLQLMNHPMNQAPGLRSLPQQQAQQQNQEPVHIQQGQVQIQQGQVQIQQGQVHIQRGQVQNTLEPAAQDAEITGLSPVEIAQNKVFKKLQILNEKYLQDMNELYIMLTHRSNQPMPAEQLQKLKHYKDVLHRMIPYLRVPKERVPKEFNMEKVEAFEKQITSIMDTFKRRRNPQPEVGNVARAVHPHPEVGNVARAVHPHPEVVHIVPAQPEVAHVAHVVPAQPEVGNGVPSEVQVN